MEDQIIKYMVNYLFDINAFYFLTNRMIYKSGQRFFIFGYIKRRRFIKGCLLKNINSAKVY